METKPEGQEPQKTPEVVEEKVTLTKAELDELKHKAEVSSQNFARLKKLEDELEQAKANKLTEAPSEDEVFSDEGKALKKEIGALKNALSEVTADNAKRGLQERHPVLKDKWTEFEEFRSLDDNKGLNLNTAAKAFLIERDLLSDSPARKGLERPTGGPKLAQPTGKMSAVEVETLRVTNYKKYMELLKEGKINIQ